MKKCILLGRVSTAQQNVDMQIDELKKVCKQRNWHIARVMTSTISGSKTEQSEEIDNILKMGSRGEFEILVVYSVDRLSRSVSHFCQIVQQLTDRNIKIYFHRENLDTTDGIMAKCMLQIMSVFASLEHSIIKSRVKTGILKYRKKHNTSGRKKTFIFSVMKTKILNMRFQKNFGIRKIATEMRLGVCTIYKVLNENQKEVA